MQIMETFTALWAEIRVSLQASLPLLLQAVVVYLIIRFALVISSVIVRLSKFNIPPPDPVEFYDPENPESGQSAEEGQGEPSTSGATPALPESTSDS